MSVDKLKGVDIFKEEILVQQGKSQLSAALRSAVLIRAQQLRALEKMLDRDAVINFQRLMNKCPWWVRLGLAKDLIFGKLGQMKVNTTINNGKPEQVNVEVPCAKQEQAAK